MGKWNQSNLFPTIEKWYRINSFPYCWSNIHFWMVWPSFHLYIGMILIRREKLCLGKIPYSSLKAHFHSHARQKFPHSWLSSCGKKNSTTRGFAACGGIFFHHACWAIHGKIFDLHGNENKPFVTHREFNFPHSRLRRSWGKFQSTISLCRSIAHS